MTQLPDPRRFGSAEPGAALSECSGAAASDSGASERCRQALRLALEAGDDAAVSSLLHSAADPNAYRALWELVCAAAEQPADALPGSVVTRAFALPVVFIAAAREPLLVPGVLPDIAAVRALLERHGVLGATRNFGVSNALCPLEAVEAVAPSTVYRWTATGAEAAPRELDAREIRVARRPEQVHLRFLVGAGVCAAEAPSLSETGATIGAWGMPLARELGRQLAQPGLDLLAIPRPPAALLRAAPGGRRAQLELAFHLFASNAVRRFRAETGDPVAVVSAHRLERGGGELRVSLSSTLDEGALEGFRWPLYPLDDLPAIERAITGFFGECRLGEVRVMERMLPNLLEDGSAFVSVRRADALARRDAAH